MINDRSRQISIEIVTIDSAIRLIESTANTPEGELKQVLQKVTGDCSNIYHIKFDPTADDHNQSLFVYFKWQSVNRQAGVYLENGHWVYYGTSLS